MLWDRMVFSLSSYSWKMVGFRAFLGSARGQSVCTWATLHSLVGLDVRFLRNLKTPNARARMTA